MQSQHKNAFYNSMSQVFTDTLGTSAASWYSHIAKSSRGGALQNLSKHPASRETLFRMSSDFEVSDFDLTIAILAWGGMRRDSGRSALSNFKSWRFIISKLRQGELDRADAFEVFAEIRRNGELKGMGIAYFTKLVFFAGQNHDGYIMDQWTARSVNLLADEEVVKLRWAKLGKKRIAVVSDLNTANDYVAFCEFIEAIAEEASDQTTPQDVEKAMFSMGRGKGIWRNYLKSKDDQ